MSLLTSFTRQSAGNVAILQTYDPVTGSPASITSGYIYAGKLRVNVATRISTLTYEVGTASGNVDLGIFQLVGSTYTLIANTGSTAASGSSARQAIALTTAVTLIPGTDYWLAFVADNGTITALRTSTNVGMDFNNRALIKTSQQVPLANFSSPVASSGALIWIGAS